MGLSDFLNFVAATECIGSKCGIGNDGAMGEGPFLSKIAISFNFLGADSTGGWL